MRSLAAALLLTPMLGPGPAGATPAQDPAGEERPLIVGVKQAAPFAIKAPDGSWKGLSVGLWEEIADELWLRYEFRERSLEGLIGGLSDGSIDVSVAALTITPERERAIDFTHPFYNSGLGIAVSARPTRSWMGTIWGLVASVEFLEVVGVLFAALLGVGLVAWLVERRANPEQFGGKGIRGLFQGVWWSAVTMTTVGYGDKAPRTVAGRLLATLWMFSSLVAVSAFTATIASLLTLSRLQSPVDGPEDLTDVRVASVAESTSGEYLRSRRIPFTPYADPLDSLQAVSDDRADAAVYDMPILRYLIVQELDAPVTVLPHRFERQNYGIGLPAGSPMREPINRVLLRKVSEPEWDERLQLYLGRL